MHLNFLTLMNRKILQAVSRDLLNPWSVFAT